MPKENLYWSGQVDGDGRAPDLTISWGTTPQPQVLLNGHPVDRSTINRLIRDLRRARDHVYEPDA